MKSLLTRFKLPVIICVGLLILVIIFFFVIRILTPSSNLPNSSTDEPPSTSLTSQEKAYPEISAQPFNNDAKPEKGMLVVTSEPEGARIRIDNPDEEAPDKEGIDLPIHITPFKSTDIPVGKHTLTIGKAGYNLESRMFEIKEGTVTRIHLILRPLSDEEGFSY